MPFARHARAEQLPDLNWRFPDARFDDDRHETPPGPAVCTRCHAYLETDHWSYGEARARELAALGGTARLLCPGCTRVQRRLYEGEVRIQLRGGMAPREEVMGVVHHEEARARSTNPTARIAHLEEHADELYLLTTTQFLALAIGRALQHAFHGELTVQDLPHERFRRVRWQARPARARAA
jgi:hypothetical protein